MTCTDCHAATQTNGQWPQYNPLGCKYCAARLIQSLDKLRSPTSQGIRARQHAVLADAVAAGHSETEIRELVKVKEMALAPVEDKRK